MTITASGAGAAYLSPVLQQNGTWGLQLTAIPTTRDVAIVLTEAQAGYDNSPRATSFGLIYEGIASGSGALDIALGTIASSPANRTVKPAILPAASATGLKTNYATIWTQAMSPGDGLDWYIDFTDLLEGAGLDGIVSITENADAGAFGLALDPATARKPLLDKNAAKLRLFLVCTPVSGSTAFDGVGKVAGFTFVIATTASPPRFWEVTAALTLRRK